ncbi:MAG: hypothetical protein EXS18_06560 [Verrucomicrobiae bacterium]|nr:hypothetical protein [Verrucomicrobiae bacterium]
MLLAEIAIVKKEALWGTAFCLVVALATGVIALRPKSRQQIVWGDDSSGPRLSAFGYISMILFFLAFGFVALCEAIGRALADNTVIWLMGSCFTLAVVAGFYDCYLRKR